MRIRLLSFVAAAALVVPAVAHAGYRETVLATHPAAYWSLGETAGPAADLVHGFPGRYREPGPGVSWQRGAAGIPGGADGGLWIHGNGDVRGGSYAGGTVELSQRNGWSGASYRDAFTVNVWLRWDGYVPYFTSDLTQGIVGNENDAELSGGWSLTIPGGTGEPGKGRLQFMHSRWDTGFVTAPQRLAVGEWTMVTASYDGLTMRLYQNGALVGQADDPRGMYGGYSDTVFVGAQDFNRFFSGYWGSFNGTLDELTFWGRALGADEVAALHRAGAEPPPPAAGKPILYFVPGVAGSELKERHDTIGDLSVWPDAIVWSHVGPVPLDPVEALRVEADGTTPAHDVYASKVQDSAFGSDVYGFALSELQSLVDTGIASELDRFAYDWRLGVDRAADELALNLAARCHTPQGPIWLITHSTGGLVAKAALRKLRERGGVFTPERCLDGGGVFFLAVPHGGAPKAIGAIVDPDLFFGGFLQKAIADAPALSHVVNNWLTVWQLMPPRANNHDPFAARDGWFNDPNDGLGDRNVNGDLLNWVLDEKANLYAPYVDDVSSTVGELPVYNVFGVDTETPGVYEPGTCDEVLGHRVYAFLGDHVHLSRTIYGDGTVPAWSAAWPGASLREQSEYAIGGEQHGHIPAAGAVQALISLVVAGASYPDVTGLAHGQNALSLADAQRLLTWRTDICSPVAAVAEYAGGEIGMQPDGTLVDELPRALFQPSSEDDGSKAQTFVIPQTGVAAPPVYRLTAIGDGPVSIWQTDLDGSRHDFVFDARKGDTATLFRGAGEWGLAIDRGGDGSVDVTLVANTPSVRLPHTATTTEGGSLQLHADAVSPNAAPIDYRWELVSGDGQLSGVRADATYQAADGPATARVRVTASANGTSVSAETTIEIANAPPSAAAGGDLEADWGSPVTLHGSADDPSAADRATLQVHWSFGDGTGADGVEATHLYVMPGTYTATLRVTDKDGATAADEATVTVTVRQTAGAATVGATTTGGGKLSGNLHSDGTETKGELEWRGADDRRLRVQSFTAFVRRGDEAWALGTADEGGILVVHLVAGEPPRVEVWLDGVPQPGSGAVAEGAVKVREG